MVKLYYSLVYSHLIYALLARGRSGSNNAAKIECAHRRACKLLTDYNQKILTFHSIYDYFALLNLLKLPNYMIQEKISQLYDPGENHTAV